MIQYIYSLIPSIFEGLKITIKIFIITVALSIPLGFFVALCRLSTIKIISKVTQFYIWIMRGTPLLLQLVLIFFGLPYVGLVFNRSTAAFIAFILNYGAYFGEIFRSGIQSIDKGQYEAGEVLGLSKTHIFIRIILPQVIKRVIPPVANEVITLIKDTSLVYVVGIGELLRAGKIASNRDASLMPLVLIGIIYLILTAILTRGFNLLEKKYEYYQ
ncbi:amino acid ABC transporter permease [Sporosalibacterium faouarense]|uniref:amino acid ABC transporter permease n=1 Tax=Sporosalibacterium faouarense TaxID=516123 RepID=UPI00311CDDBB